MTTHQEGDTMTDQPTIVETVEAATGLNGATLLDQLAIEGLEVVPSGVRALAEKWDADADANEDSFPVNARTMRFAASDLRAALDGGQR